MMAQDAVGLPAPVMQVCKSYFQSQNVYFSSETLFEMWKSKLRNAWGQSKTQLCVHRGGVLAVCIHEQDMHDCAVANALPLHVISHKTEPCSSAACVASYLMHNQLACCFILQLHCIFVIRSDCSFGSMLLNDLMILKLHAKGALYAGADCASHQHTHTHTHTHLSLCRIPSTTPTGPSSWPPGPWVNASPSLMMKTSSVRWSSQQRTSARSTGCTTLIMSLR